MDMRYFFLPRTWLFCLLLTFGTRAFVLIQGVAPSEISKAGIQAEYKRQWTVLAPEKLPLERDTLVVRYSSRKWVEDASFSLPEWGGGGAVGEHLIIVLTDRKPFLEFSPTRTTYHELAHIVINRIAGDIHIPRWFHEGVAMLLSGDLSGAEQAVLSQAIFRNSLLSLSSIDSVNAFGRFSAQLAYAQSRQAALFLVDTYGMETLRILMEETRRQKSFERGLYETVGLSIPELNELVIRRIQKRFGPLLWLMDSRMIWAGIVLLAIVAFFAVRIRIAHGKKRLAQEDEAPPGDGSR